MSKDNRARAIIMNDDKLSWGRRLLLPSRRGSETENIEWKNWIWTFTVSSYSDGKLAEIFIDTPTKGDLARPKSGSDLALLVQDAAVVASIALQYGAPIQVLASAVQLGARGEPLTIFSAVLQSIAKRNQG
jgi:ribonucleoside-diphosphate reductase alpha chain